jgi:hypothetical protein
MVRHLGSDRYELIHDQLAKQVNEKLIIARKDLKFKQIREHLCTVAMIYSDTSIILDPAIMARMYFMRERINPTFSEKLILLHSCIAQKGPAWFWFRKSERNEYLSALCAAISHQSIRLSAIRVMGYTRYKEVVTKLIELINGSDEVICTVVEAMV